MVYIKYRVGRSSITCTTPWCILYITYSVVVDLRYGVVAVIRRGSISWSVVKAQQFVLSVKPYLMKNRDITNAITKMVEELNVPVRLYGIS